MKCSVYIYPYSGASLFVWCDRCREVLLHRGSWAGLYLRNHITKIASDHIALHHAGSILFFTLKTSSELWAIIGDTSTAFQRHVMTLCGGDFLAGQFPFPMFWLHAWNLPLLSHVCRFCTLLMLCEVRRGSHLRAPGLFACRSVQAGVQ